ncbi:MAG: zinc-binding dehydrogenase [Gemmatimonadales bacterium]
MRALTLAALGGPEQLALRDVPAPELTGPEDVLIRIHAAALNHLDLFVMDGLPGVQLGFPHIMAGDGAGVIEAVGPAVKGWKPGDRVMFNPGISCYRCEPCLSGDHSLCTTYRLLGEHMPGTAAELAVIPAKNLAPVPERMSWAQAAAFSLANITSWRMLVTRARLKPGETILLWGIGGGVALASLKIARLIGATVIVTSSSDAKLERARALGADAALNHATMDIPKEVRALTGRRGADVVMDNVGEQTWERSIRCLSRQGRLVTCGGTTGPMVTTDVRKLFWYQHTIMGSTMGSWSDYQAVTRLAQLGRLWPEVDSVYPLEQGRAAVERMMSGSQFGKIVLEVAP